MVNAVNDVLRSDFRFCHTPKPRHVFISSVHHYHHNPAASCLGRRPQSKAQAPGVLRSSRSDGIVSVQARSASILPNLRHYYRCLMNQYRGLIPPLRMYPLQNLDYESNVLFHFLPFSYEPDHGINTNIHIMHAKRAAD